MSAMATPSEIPLNINMDTFATYSDALQAAALTTTRLVATSLPADLSFHRSIDPELTRDIDGFSDRVLRLTSKLLHVASGKAGGIQEEEDIVDEFVRNVVDPMEGVLESTDSALDVFLGKRKDPAIHVPAVPVIDPSRNKPRKPQFGGRLDPALTHASHILKPQSSFMHAVSNADESPYIPATLMPHKWCAKVPLGYVFHDERLDHGVESDREDDEEERRKRMLHPYHYELTHPSHPDHAYEPPVEPSLPPPLETPSSGAPTTAHSLTFISTPKAFLSMANTISSVTELAVDLEHHSYRSYKGFLALMQISTRKDDFVIDLLAPEIREGLRQGVGKNVKESEEVGIASEAGQIIARVFADPSIIKVFHGAESDIMWLQQDFNIFVVGLFDTFHASKVLEFTKHSLAYLLETYCDFIPDKRYQLADWRIRPLPTEMLAYARSDTHFLLYIYDMLRLSLIKRSSTTSTVSGETCPFTDTPKSQHKHPLIHDVLTRSSRTALRLYDVELYDAEGGTGSNGWDTLARKWNKIGLAGSPLQTRGMEVQGLQAAVYKAVHRWREDVAREEDESTRYVLPTHQLFLVAERAPTTVLDLLALFGGPGVVNGSVPPVLKRRTGELVAIIKGSIETTKSSFIPQEQVKDGHGDAGIMDSMVVENLGAMSSTIASPSTTKVTDASRLWAVASSSTSAATDSASCSSLFDVGICGERPPGRRSALPSLVGREGSYFAMGSVLFGNALSKGGSDSFSSTIKSTFTHGQASDDSAERFKDLVEKIHKTLVIAPVISMPPLSSSVNTQALETSLSGVPMITEVKQHESVAPEAPDSMSPGVAGQIEIPFVSAHKRQALSNQQDRKLKDDTIVVVGQVGARQRKRKRNKAKSIVLTPQLKSGAQPVGADVPTSAGDQDLKMEGFDYSSVPNLLDDESKQEDAWGGHEQDERRKKKQRHGKGPGLFEYGASPRDQREVRSGNKTHTFR